MSISESDGYDIVIDIDSLESLGKKCFENSNDSWDNLNIPQKGWNIYFKDFEKYHKFKEIKTKILGIVGNSNRGKTFILQKITGMNLYPRFSVKTKGISLKFPDTPDRNVTILDSAGLESPLLENDDSANIFEGGFSKFSRINAIKKIAKDKLMTEKFLRDFILHYSNVIIAVVNILTYEEQVFLQGLTNLCSKEKKKLFIIHNLSVFVEVDQVKQYIDEVLLNSSTFQLKKNKMILANLLNELPEKKNELYFTEILEDNEDIEVFHFLMANDNSKAGYYFNEPTINFIRAQIEIDNDLKKFDILQEIKKYLITFSKKYMTELLDEKSFNEDDRLIRLKNEDAQITYFDRCLDEVDFNGRSFEPNYCYYPCNDGLENWFVVALEIYGTLKDVKCNVSIKNGYYYFEVSGERIANPSLKTNADSSKSGSTVTIGNFSVKFHIKYSSLKLKSLTPKKHERELGYLVLYFETKADC